MSALFSFAAPAPKLARRTVLASGLALVVANAALAQSSIEQGLRSLQQELALSSAFLLNFANILRTATQDGDLSPEEEAELREFLSSINELQMVQSQLVTGLERYSASAHSGDLSAGEWQDILDAVGQTGERLHDAVAVSQSSEAWRAQLGTDQAAQMSAILDRRGAILSGLSDLAPPSTDDELAALDDVIAEYNGLIDSLSDLRAQMESALQ